MSGTPIKYLLDDIYYTFLKNEDNIITIAAKAKSIGKVTSFSLNKDNIYLPINGKYALKLSYSIIGSVKDKPYWYSENDEIASVDQDGNIIANKKVVQKYM